jgi:hypothetical protein
MERRGGFNYAAAEIARLTDAEGKGSALDDANRNVQEAGVNYAAAVVVYEASRNR